MAFLAIQPLASGRAWPRFAAACDLSATPGPAGGLLRLSAQAQGRSRKAAVLASGGEPADQLLRCAGRVSSFVHRLVRFP
jgi:hypothetical protein